MCESTIITGVVALAGVAIGAGLSYKVLERSRKHERKDRIQEGAIDALVDFYHNLKAFQSFIQLFRKTSTKMNKKSLYDIQKEIGAGYINASNDLLKSQLKVKLYIKKDPIIESLKKFKEEMDKFSGKMKGFADLIEKTDYLTKIDDKLGEQLEEQIEELADAIVKIRDALIAG